ncbi:MAG: hypothetical protein AVDCRST_MAG73-1126 [uncultured Thermomicrobiales bacterium]|uniref:Putative restriction endonuclease domain-containing protein n=1 Tax=uncultured Thermomicrobiales bacterium TaxID=1645740 RepID=A0A6J4TVD2_9BACT|nr:MAG: hypothetical protein AVDCRST_MAG73-1126 [uncultured Thermomicrobiales bacterium]
MTATALFTLEDVERLPDDAHRYDVIRGELIRLAAATAKHGRSANNIHLDMGLFARDRGLGRVYSAETGFVLSRDPLTLLCPDVAFVRANRVPSWDDDEGFFPGPPDLAVEIRSPSETGPDVARKVGEYLAAGTTLVWYADPPHRVVDVHRSGRAPMTLGNGDALDGEDVLPGFRLPVAHVFR